MFQGLFQNISQGEMLLPSVHMLCMLDVLVVLGIASRVCKSDPGQWTVPPPSRQLGNLAALCSFDQLTFDTLDVLKTDIPPSNTF